MDGHSQAAGPQGQGQGQHREKQRKEKAGFRGISVK